MAPALTKPLKDDHGIHLSSPAASFRVDLDARDMCTVELEPHTRATDNGDLNKLSLQLEPSSPPSSSANPPMESGILTSAQTYSSKSEMVSLPPSLESLVRLLRDSHEVALPGVSTMLFIPVSEHNSQEGALWDGQNVLPECEPDGGDVDCSFPTLTSVGPSYSHMEIASLDHPPICKIQPERNYQELAQRFCPFPLNSKESKNTLEEAVNKQLVRHMELQRRACRLQKRLQILLCEDALVHCSQQLKGLGSHRKPRDGPVLDPVQDAASSTVPSSWEKLSSALPPLTEVREFCHSSWSLVRGLQEALDSEATASSSSEDETEQDLLRGKLSYDCERQWLQERAELSSRWTWLRLRVSQLDVRIRELEDVHKHVRSTKGRVVLAESLPVANRQTQQTLRRERASLSSPVPDADSEPCSPTHLLHNIERQSAQLSLMVNSLIPPLSFSPLSKEASEGKGTLASDVFLPRSSKKRKLEIRKLFKADAQCTCARIRPLVSYHKHKLFVFNSHDSSTKSTKSRSPLFAFSSSSPSPYGPSDPDCDFRSHSLLPPAGFTACHQMERNGAREEWLQRPLVINSRVSSPLNYSTTCSSPRHRKLKCKMSAWHQKKLPSPIRLSCNHKKRANQRRRKKGRTCRMLHDGQDVLAHFFDLEESSDVLEESHTQDTHSQSSQGLIHKYHGDILYNINNIVIPVSNSRAEKPQYKDILIPSWRVIDMKHLTETETKEEKDKKEWQMEDLSDSVFSQRHLAQEQKEKLLWTCWEKRTLCRHPTRRCSRLSGCTSGEESSVEMDSDELRRSEERTPQAPWKPRVFPLDEADEDTLLPDEVPSAWTESRSLPLSSKHSSSHLSPGQAACIRLPPPGQRRS